MELPCRAGSVGGTGSASSLDVADVVVILLVPSVHTVIRGSLGL